MTASRVSSVGVAVSLALLLANCGSETRVGTAPPPPPPVTTARQITDPADLIGGPLARGRVGDYLLKNDKIRTIIRQPGRAFHFTLTYGGNIIDADLVRAAGDPDRDSFEAATPLINVSSTVNVDTVTVVNDGSDGEPAVLRTHGVDDLFDAFDPTNAIRSLGGGLLNVPDSARDKDIPVEIVTTYTLRPGDDYVHIRTDVKNITKNGETLNVYLGDYVNGSGEFDQFVPGLGFGEVQIRDPMPFLGFAGLGQAEGVSYGIIPQEPSSAFADSGITAYLANQDVLFVLLGSEAPFYVIEPDATKSYERYFVVGHGDVGSIVDARNRILGTPTGTIRGRVQAGGKPAANAIVSIVKDDPKIFNNLIDSFRTDASGHYEGTLPEGTYSLAAKAEGYPYESGGNTTTWHPLAITAGGVVEQDVELPGTGTLEVTVKEDDKPIAAKVSVVGFDASPDPRTKTSIFGTTFSGFVFSSPIKQRNKLMYGLVNVLFAGLDGRIGPTPLQPGEYQVVVTHGPEYSAFKQNVTITAGQTTTVEAKVAHVVDTEGFASADYHVHMINSHDSWVTKEERILTMLAEGVDHFVATDHDFRTDLTPELEKLGAQGHLSVGVSEETTTFDIGHFNIWPVPIDPNSIIGGSFDWGRADVDPGMDYPSLGSYDLSPKEIFEQAPAAAVKQVNHVNSHDFGYLSLAGIDTMGPPQSLTPPTLLRQDPSITNLYDDGFTAMELWIEGNRDQTNTFLTSNLGDWFNLLNQGIIKTATSDSDSHSTAVVQAGGPRNFVASPTDVPGEMSTQVLADSVNEGRVIGSNGPFLRVSITGDGDQTAGLALGQARTVTATDKTATLRIRVQSPEWAEFDTIDIYVNTVPTPVYDDPNIFEGVEVDGVLVPQAPRYAVSPTISLKKGTHFKVDSVEDDPSIPGASHLESKSLQGGEFVEHELQLDRDAWVVVVVSGTDGVSKPLWPMNPQDLNEASNKTLDQLTDGNLDEGGQPALAYSNPLFVDVGGNGQYDLPQ